MCYRFKFVRFSLFFMHDEFVVVFRARLTISKRGGVEDQSWTFSSSKNSLWWGKYWVRLLGSRKHGEQ